MSAVLATRLPAAQGIYLVALQALFLLTWVVYVIYLPELAGRLGWPAEWVPRLLLLDQVLFAVADIVLGLHADRILPRFRRFAPFVLTLNLIACLAFIALPWLTTAGAGLFLATTALWLVTSAVLRAPLYGLIAQRLAPASAGRGQAALLLGMGLASAAGPYLGLTLKGIDPAWVFTLSGTALALITLAFSHLTPTAPAAPAGGLPNPAALRRLILAMGLLGLGFQFHVFVNATPLYKTVAAATDLPWLLPVFWIGFSLALYPGARWSARRGPETTLRSAALLGTGASLACLLPLPLPALIGIQALAGVAWGLAFLAALDLAGRAGHSGREALYIGLLFASLALAAAARITYAALGLQAELPHTLALAAACWMLGALLAWHSPPRSPAPLPFSRSPA